MSRNKKEFDIGDILLHTDFEISVIGWVSAKQDFGYGVEYTVDWADGFCNGEWYSFDWIDCRVEQLKNFLDGKTT